MYTRSMNENYRDLLTELKNYGETEVNARTKTEITMLLGGHSFKLDMAENYLPVPGNRRYYPHVAAAEVAWQFMGTKDPSFILAKAPKLWSKFVEKELVDSDTNPTGKHISVLKTAYGYRWRQAFGRDQLMLAIRELESNPTNRQLWIQAWDPRCDGLGGPQPKNIPCPIGFTLSRFDGKIHMSVFVRSSDVFVGLPYDVMGYALTLDAIAATVGCEPGTLHFTLAHPHLYEPHYDDALTSLDASPWMNKYEVQPKLPGWDVGNILTDPDGYVDIVKKLCSGLHKHSWDPMPPVIE